MSPIEKAAEAAAAWEVCGGMARRRGLGGGGGRGALALHVLQGFAQQNFGRGRRQSRPSPAAPFLFSNGRRMKTNRACCASKVLADDLIHEKGQILNFHIHTSKTMRRFVAGQRSCGNRSRIFVKHSRWLCDVRNLVPRTPGQCNDCREKSESGRGERTGHVSRLVQAQT